MEEPRCSSRFKITKRIHSNDSKDETAPLFVSSTTTTSSGIGSMSPTPGHLAKSILGACFSFQSCLNWLKITSSIKTQCQFQRLIRLYPSISKTRLEQKAKTLPLARIIQSMMGLMVWARNFEKSFQNVSTRPKSVEKIRHRSFQRHTLNRLIRTIFH